MFVEKSISTGNGIEPPEIARVIEQDLADAQALNVTKTPEFFVNGQPLPRFGYEPLKQLVNSALTEASRTRQDGR